MSTFLTIFIHSLFYTINGFQSDTSQNLAFTTEVITNLKFEANDEITLKQEQTKDNSDLLDKLNHVQDTTNPNEGRIDPLEDDGPETTKNFVLDLRETERMSKRTIITFPVNTPFGRAH